MQINKSTWHYKVWEFSNSRTRGYIPNGSNLCRYFWRVLLTFLWIPFYAGFCFILWSFGRKRNDGRGEWYLESKKRLIATISVFLVVDILFPVAFPSEFFKILCWKIPIGSLIGFAFLMGTIKLIIFLRDRPQKAKDTNSFFYITKEFLRAKKNKICPLITFDDEKPEVR